MLWKLVFTYLGTGKGREIEYKENTNVKMQGKYIENPKQKWAVIAIFFNVTQTLVKETPTNFTTKRIRDKIIS